MAGTLAVRETLKWVASSSVGMRQGISSWSTAEMTGRTLSAKMTSGGVTGKVTGGTMIVETAGS